MPRTTKPIFAAGSIVFPAGNIVTIDMESNADTIDRLAELLSTLDNPKTTRDARIDIYLVLVR